MTDAARSREFLLAWCLVAATVGIHAVGMAVLPAPLVRATTPLEPHFRQLA